MSRRAVEIGCAVTAWHLRGGRIGFLTFTMRHYLGQALPMLWASGSKAWGSVTAGKVWLADQSAALVEGYLRVAETTWGANGWHVHFHVLVFLDGSSTEEDLSRLHGSMFGRWSRSLQRQGLDAPLAVGQDARFIDSAGDSDLAAYLAKAVDHADSAKSIALEFTWSQGKNARHWHKTYTPWALLDLVEFDGDAHALDLWHEWEKGSKGKRQLTWSKGLRDRLGLGEEDTDEAIAQEELGSALDDLLNITAAGWDRVVSIPGANYQVLKTVKAQGFLGLRAYLEANKIEYARIGN